VVLLSPGHRLGNDRSPGVMRRLREEVGESYRAAGVALFAIHTAGLSPLGMTAEMKAPSRRSDRAFMESRMPGVQDQWAENALLASAALATGGRLFQSSSNWPRLLDHVSDDLGSFYRMTYTPPAAGGAPDFRRLRVEVRGSGLRVRHRSGYVTAGSVSSQAR
jgi:VWFA-related protein